MAYLFNGVLKCGTFSITSWNSVITITLVFILLYHSYCAKHQKSSFYVINKAVKILKNNNTKHDQYHGIKKTESHDSPNMNTIRKFSSLGCSLRGEEYFFINYFPYIFLIKKRIQRMVLNTFKNIAGYNVKILKFSWFDN